MMADQSRGEESLLGRTFDSYQNMMQVTACFREAARQTGAQNVRILELSRLPTSLGEFMPEAIVTRYPTHDGDTATLSSPVALPFPAGSFDGCFVTDAYEHLPSGLRKGFLREMLRVTDGLVLVGCPHGNEVVTRLDRMVFDFIWGKYGERFTPLEQHVMYGTERVDQIIDSLKEEGADIVTALPCNYVYRWIQLILIYFDLQHRNPHGDLYEPFNRVYNSRLSKYDYREPCYRYLIVVPTRTGLNIEDFDSRLTSAPEPSELTKETDAMLLETFRTIESESSDRLRQCSEQIQELQHNNEWATREIARLNQIIVQLQNDNAWANQEISRLCDLVAELRADGGSS